MFEILCLSCKHYGEPVVSSYGTHRGIIEHLTFVHCIHPKVEGDIIPRTKCPHYEVKENE